MIRVVTRPQAFSRMYCDICGEFIEERTWVKYYGNTCGGCGRIMCKDCGAHEDESIHQDCDGRVCSDCIDTWNQMIKDRRKLNQAAKKMAIDLKEKVKAELEEKFGVEVEEEK